MTKRQRENRRRWADALMTSKKHRFALASADGPGKCCLGVVCNVLAGVPRKDMVGFAAPKEVGVDLWSLTGATEYEESRLVHMNDTSGWTHRDIGLYLYLTAEAGFPGC